MWPGCGYVHICFLFCSCKEKRKRWKDWCWGWGDRGTHENPTLLQDLRSCDALLQMKIDDTNKETIILNTFYH